MIVRCQDRDPGIGGGRGRRLAKPYLISIGWLEAGQPFRRSASSIIALGTILGAAIAWTWLPDPGGSRQEVDREGSPAGRPQRLEARFNVFRLVSWVMFWGVAGGSRGSHSAGRAHAISAGLPSGSFFCCVLVNGISLGISDSNPISSASLRRMTVFVLAAIGPHRCGCTGC